MHVKSGRPHDALLKERSCQSCKDIKSGILIVAHSLLPNLTNCILYDYKLDLFHLMNLSLRIVAEILV